MSTEGSGASRGGGEEFHNEDAFLAAEGLGLYVVSDGASDRPAGEVAGAVATHALERFVADAGFDPSEPGGVDDALVAEGMRRALAAVRTAGRERLGRDDIDASVTMLLTDGQRGVIGHRGDSRAYLIRRRRAVQLTVDQELTDDVTHADDVGIQVFALDLRPGDTVVLCTDGAEAVVEDDAIVRAAGEVSPRVLASRIVSAANRRFPDQDATAVAVRVRSERGPERLETSGRPERTAFGHTLPPKTGSATSG